MSVTQAVVVVRVVELIATALWDWRVRDSVDRISRGSLVLELEMSKTTALQSDVGVSGTLSPAVPPSGHRTRKTSSDEELLAAWRGGDRGSGNELFHRHFEAIRRFFINKVDHKEIEDLVQGTFEACIKSQQKYRSEGSVRNFLFGIAHNKLREFIRAKNRANKRGPTTDLGTKSIVDLGTGPSTAVANNRQQRALLEGLRRIPLEFQVILELYYWEQISGRELGEILDVPEDTARSRIRRAKQLLREELKAIHAAPEALASTVHNLDDWAAKVRAGFDPQT